MTQSETIGALSKALAAAQAELENADKKKKNDHYKSSYADLAEVLNTCRPVLARHGLAVVQSPSAEKVDGSWVVSVETQLSHAETGEWQKGVLSTPVTKADPQGVGSAITYLRRYALAAMVGIAQEDDDGNAASGKAPKAAPAKASPKGEPPTETAIKATTSAAELTEKAVKWSLEYPDEWQKLGPLAKAHLKTLS